MNKELKEHYIGRLYNAGFILNQATYLSKALADEHKKLEEMENYFNGMTFKSKIVQEDYLYKISGEFHWVNATLKSSLEYSLLLMQFAFIESLVNAVGSCALELNKTKNQLSDAEITFLTEKVKIYDKGKVKETFKFFTLEEKLEYYPKIFAKLNGHEFSLQKNKYWEFFKKAKSARDSMTHPKVDFNGIVNKQDLFNTAKVLYWYHDDVSELFKLCVSKDFSSRFTETLAYAILVNINKACNKGQWKYIPQERKKFESQGVFNIKNKKRLTKNGGAQKKLSSVESEQSKQKKK